MPTLVAYNRTRAAELLRTWTAQQVFDDAYAGRFSTTLTDQQVEELVHLTGAWIQRALGPLTLRDALLVDPRRGATVYNLICTMQTVAHVRLSAHATTAMRQMGTGEMALHQIEAVLDILHTPQPDAADDAERAIHTLLEQARAEQLALVYCESENIVYPFPTDLASLLTPLPAAFPHQSPQFEYPTGIRRTLAIVLVLIGVGLLGIPLIMGSMPVQPAGVPLALLTLALLVGIKARWPGYIGAVCVWLVPNLPGFHHGTLTTILWPGIALLLGGIILLAYDRQVRAMWYAIWGGTKRKTQSPKPKARSSERDM